MEALQYGKPFDASIWHKDLKDEVWWERRHERSQSATTSPVGSKKGSAQRPEPRIGALLRAAWALTESEDPARYADAIARYLDVSREELYSMPLAEFVEKYESVRFSEEIDDVYDEELEQEDEEFLAHVKSYQGNVLDPDD